MNLAFRAIVNAVAGVFILGALIFVPAGTLFYWQGWAFIFAFTGSTTIMGINLAVKDPALLARRMKAGPGAETRRAQKIIISLAFVSFLMLPVVAAFDHRFGWSQVPAWISILGNFMVALGLMIDLLVFHENSYAASTIEKMEGQRLISSGPYALVRHPMYFGLLIMVLGAPLALGSYWGSYSH